MTVKITSYRVRPAAGSVDVDLEITLPTGSVGSTIVATEATLEIAAQAAGRQTWDERDLVAVVGNVFAALASTVSVDEK